MAQVAGEARDAVVCFAEHLRAAGIAVPADVAVSVLTSVVSRRSMHAVVDAGALALSKDPGPSWHRPETYGEIWEEKGGQLSPSLRTTGLSQEHGLLALDP